MDASEIGVVFDCDGTLLDSMGVWHGLQNELAERAGDTLTADDVAALAPMSIPECGAFFHEKFGLGESDHEVVGMIDGSLALVLLLMSLGFNMLVKFITRERKRNYER